MSYYLVRWRNFDGTLGLLSGHTPVGAIFRSLSYDRTDNIKNSTLELSHILPHPALPLNAPAILTTPSRSMEVQMISNSPVLPF